MTERLLEDQILDSLSEFPAVGITGPRQVGKTTLAKAIGQQYSNCLHLDLEKPSDLAKLEDPELFLRSKQDQLVILDEIQRKPELFPVLRVLIDEHRHPARFMILGSASPELLRQSSESLAGRIVYHELTPFLLKEANELDRLWTRGGFPASYISRSGVASLKWRQEFIRSYMERELPQLGFPTDSVKASRFLRMIASVQGQLWNAEMFAKALEISTPRINEYRHFLESSYLTRDLLPWSGNLKKRLVKSPKVYIRDTGLFHALMDIRDHEGLMGHAMCGYSWEGFAIEQILGICRDEFEPYFVRTHHGAEVDLLLVKGNSPVFAFEIKLTDAPKLPRGFASLIKELGTEKNFMVTPGSERYPVAENTEVIALKELLELLVEGGG